MQEKEDISEYRSRGQDGAKMEPFAKIVFGICFRCNNLILLKITRSASQRNTDCNGNS